MQKDFRGAYILTGGATGSLDSLSVSLFEDLDATYVQTDGVEYVYSFDSTASNAESSPLYIRPDDYTTTGVHVLQSLFRNNITAEGVITMKERAAAVADTAAYGQLWVKSGTPNTLWFTDDVGTDTQLGNADIILPKASGNGIQIDLTVPTFGWRDITGSIVPSNTGASKPSFTTYIGGIYAFQFAAGEEEFVGFHIPHDYVADTDVYLHVHWSHASALVTGGSITLEYEVSYSKGHNQSPFSATVTNTFVGNASTTQYQHIVTEIQLSAVSPSASQIDSNDLEPDGIILCRIELNANNITSSGAVPDPFIHEVDLHYQSTNIATKQKAPDFYT